jgi:hypothetical protein
MQQQYLLPPAPYAAVYIPYAVPLAVNGRRCCVCANNDVFPFNRWLLAATAMTRTNHDDPLPTPVTPWPYCGGSGQADDGWPYRGGNNPLYDN